MALTATCKKCNREVAPGDLCPHCGTKLPKNAVHAAWVLERKPVADWMSWNAVLRWLLPAGLVVLILALLLEGISGGTAAVENLFLGGFPLVLLILLCVLLTLVLVALLLQGRELTDYVVDSRGVHVTRYLPDPTPLKLLARLKSPALMRQLDPDANAPVLRLGEQDLAWKNVARVQLWPEKCYILFYAPTWWLRIPVRCTPFSWEDALVFVRDKLGKKKTVDLPDHLRVQAEKKPPARKSAPAYPVHDDPAPYSRNENFSPAPAPEPESPNLDSTDDDGAIPAFSGNDDVVPASAGEQMALDLSSSEE